MTKKSSICSSVEGSKLFFNTRQFFQNRPIFNETLKIMVYPFKLGINGYVEIEEALDDPKNKAVYSTSLTAVGDSVQGGSVDGWSTKVIKPPKLENATATHSAKFGSLKGHSYAHVQSSHRDHLQSPQIEARHPKVISVINPAYITTEN